MEKKDAYHEKIDAELEIIQAQFNEFKAQAHKLDGDARSRHARHVAEIEQHVADAKAKLLELNQAHEDVWEQIVAGIENTRKVLQSTLEDAVTSFKD
ncbi:hypothetical protein [Desulfosediminicola flagellatus]|uniref:hypothetical protein n=1 Tax=Desulfosediminicola flagellatus TaxID=2569541 RepID=UPI0010ABEC05|nr:hypothetical protein [Desulfosediminicola flagellatus]